MHFLTPPTTDAVITDTRAMGCTQSADTTRPVAVEQSAAKPPAPVHKEAELIDHMTKGVENKASNGSNAGYMRAGDEKRDTDARERARSSLIGTNPVSVCYRCGSKRFREKLS